MCHAKEEGSVKGPVMIKLTDDVNQRIQAKKPLNISKFSAPAIAFLTF